MHRCFASLFVASRDVDNLVHGSPVFQLFSNLNVLLCALRVKLMLPLGAALGLGVETSAERERYAQFATSLSSQASACALGGFRKGLLSNDSPEMLPRVFFCGISWVTPLGDASLGDDPLELLSDHRFAIIKHGDDRFQLVQGYMKMYASGSKPVSGSSLSAALDDGCTPGLPSAAFGLSAWQGMEHNKYSSRAGFNRAALVELLKGLNGFVRDPVFNSLSYSRMFGATPAGGGQYWPSLSYRELDDSDIVGFGNRSIAAAIEQTILVQGAIAKHFK